MRSFLRPLPRALTRPLSIVVLLAWVAAMAALVNRSYLQASPRTWRPIWRATDRPRPWRGVYYRGEKIGFTVSQTVPTDDGFELQEDGRLQMSLLGATTAATIRTTAQRRLGRSRCASFEFSLDPGTGPIEVRGRDRRPPPHARRRRPRAGTRTEERELPEPPALSLNLSRRLANGGLVAGAQPSRGRSSIRPRCATRR